MNTNFSGAGKILYPKKIAGLYIRRAFSVMDGRIWGHVDEIKLEQTLLR